MKPVLFSLLAASLLAMPAVAQRYDGSGITVQGGRRYEQDALALLHKSLLESRNEATRVDSLQGIHQK